MTAEHIKIVEGKIEVLGQSEINQKAQKYAYIRLLDNNNNVLTLNDVGVLNSCGSYLAPGTHVKMYLVKHKEGYALYALEAEGRKIYSYEEIAVVKKELNVFTFMGISMLVIGLATMIFLIGIPIILYAFYLMYKASSVKALYKQEDLEKPLRENGFSLV